MLELIGLVVSVGLADSLNPSTVGPALYLATGPAAVRNVAQFTAGVFLVYLAGGLLLALGPGELLLSVVPHPSSATKHLVELVAGVVLVAAGVVLWARRRSLAARPLPGRNLSGGSALLLGAGITVVELPTAVPYFAVIAAVVGSGASFVERIELLTLFCAVFCLPLLAILGMLAIERDRAKQPLRRAGEIMQTHWPDLLAALLLIVGVGFAVAGAVGFANS